MIYYEIDKVGIGGLKGSLVVSVDEGDGQGSVEVDMAEGQEGLSFRLTPVEAVALTRGLLQAVERTCYLGETKIILEQQEARQRATDRGRGAGWGM